MFRNLSKLHTPEWFKAFNPHGLVDKLLFIFRVLLSRLARITDKFMPYNSRLIKNDYSVVYFPRSSIKYMPSGRYNYKVTGIDDKYEILGYGVSNIAIRGIDYIIKDGAYFFKLNPARYCQTYELNAETFHRTIAVVGGDVRLQQTFQLNSPPDCVCSYNYDSMARYSINGISNMDTLARQGIACRGAFTGKPIAMWSEGELRLAITNTGSFICAPKHANIVLDYETSITVNDTIPSVFVVELNGMLYPVLSDVNEVDKYPNIRTIYNTLSIYGDKFLGIELYNILKNQGCNFTEIGYIKQGDKGGSICQYGRYITRIPDIVIKDRVDSDCYITANAIDANLLGTIEIRIDINVKYL